jgi:putative glycosyltransferase (TIGR04372 family)
MYSFFLRNINEVKNGRNAVLLYKIKQIIIYLNVSIPCLITIFIVRILRPIVIIRFGAIRSDVLGASMQVSEFYLSSKEINPENFIDLFYFNSKSPNKQWELMIRKQLKANQFIRYVDRINLLIPGGEKHNVNMTSYCRGYQRDLDGVYNQTKSHISFTELENEKGAAFLNKIGLRPEDKYVCLIIRDPAYKTKYFPTLPENQTTYRNSDPSTYVSTVQYLLEKGYWVLRMGKLVEKPMDIKHSRFLDYACSDLKSDFLDIWLNANCHYAFSNGSGLDEVLKTFRKPLLHVNIYPLTETMSGLKNVLTIFKHSVDADTGKGLSLNEMIKRGIFGMNMDHQFKAKNIIIENNTSEEILNALKEFELRLDGLWNESSEYQELHKKFFEKLKKWENYERYHGQILGRISETFLLNSKEWIFKN